MQGGPGRRLAEPTTQVHRRLPGCLHGLASSLTWLLLLLPPPLSFLLSLLFLSVEKRASRASCALRRSFWIAVSRLSSAAKWALHEGRAQVGT